MEWSGNQHEQLSPWPWGPSKLAQQSPVSSLAHANCVLSVVWGRAREAVTNARARTEAVNFILVVLECVMSRFLL